MSPARVSDTRRPTNPVADTAAKTATGDDTALGRYLLHVRHEAVCLAEGVWERPGFVVVVPNHHRRRPLQLAYHTDAKQTHKHHHHHHHRDLSRLLLDGSHAHLLHAILSWLSVADLCRCRLVCRQVSGAVSMTLFRHLDIVRATASKLADAGVPLQWTRSISLTRVRGRSVVVRDALLRPLLAQATALTALDLSGCVAVTDESVWVLMSACRHLRRLSLHGCDRVTDASFTTSAAGDETMPADNHDHPPLPPRLAWLDVRGCRLLTDQTIRAISHLPLSHLHLSCAKGVHGPALAALCRQCAGTLCTLTVAVCGKLTDADLLQIGLAAYRLRVLHLDRNYGRLTARGLFEFARCGAAVLEDLRIILPYQQQQNSDGAVAWTPVQLLDSVAVQDFRRTHPHIRRFTQGGHHAQ